MSVARIFPGRIILKESHELTRYYCCRSLRSRLGSGSRHGGPPGPLHRRHRPHRRRGGFSVQRNEASGSPAATQGWFPPLRGHRLRPRPALRRRAAFLRVPPLRSHLRLGHRQLLGRPYSRHCEVLGLRPHLRGRRRRRSAVDRGRRQGSRGAALGSGCVERFLRPSSGTGVQDHRFAARGPSARRLRGRRGNRPPGQGAGFELRGPPALWRYRPRVSAAPAGFAEPREVPAGLLHFGEPRPLHPPHEGVHHRPLDRCSGLRRHRGGSGSEHDHRTRDSLGRRDRRHRSR